MALSAFWQECGGKANGAAQLWPVPAHVSGGEAVVCFWAFFFVVVVSCDALWPEASAPGDPSPGTVRPELHRCGYTHAQGKQLIASSQNSA